MPLELHGVSLISIHMTAFQIGRSPSFFLLSDKLVVLMQLEMGQKIKEYLIWKGPKSCCPETSIYCQAIQHYGQKAWAVERERSLNSESRDTALTCYVTAGKLPNVSGPHSPYP